MGDALREIDAYVLPTVGKYSAYVNVDIDKFSHENGKKTHKLRINVYSPEDLDEGELARVGSELQKEWGRYIVEREQARKFYRWFKILAPVEILLISGAVAIDLIALTPPGNYMRAVWDIFFWGLILGFTGIIPGIRSLRYRRREKRARRLLKNWTETEAGRGTDAEKTKRVDEFRNHFSKMDGREVRIYEKLKNYSEETRFTPAYDFYKWKIRD